MRSPAPYLIWIVVTAVLTVFGPYGTFGHFGASELTFIWAVIVAMCILWGIALRVIFMHRFAALRFWQAALLASTVSALVLALPIRAFLVFVAQGVEADAPSFLLIYTTILQIGMGLGVARIAMDQAGWKAPQPLARADGPKLLERLEPGRRGDIVRLAARDHYLDVFMANGKAELLLRFSDALAELEGVAGMQVHRSHWVAREAVAGAERQGDKVHLLMRDGARVPVSKKYRGELAAFGLGPDQQLGNGMNAIQRSVTALGRPPV